LSHAAQTLLKTTVKIYYRHISAGKTCTADLIAYAFVGVSEQEKKSEQNFRLISVKISFL